jgi:hypothetical protein
VAKKEVVVGAAIVVAVAAAVGGALVGKYIASSKVIIITDGSVKLHVFGKKLKKDPNHPKNHIWDAKGDKVVVGDCDAENPKELDFDKVEMQILNGSSTKPITFENVGGNLVIKPDAYEIKGSGSLFRIHEGSAHEQLEIGTVTVRYGTGLETFPFDGSKEACVAFE